VGSPCSSQVEFRTSYKVLIKNLSERDTSGDLGLGERGILKCNFKELVCVCGCLFPEWIKLYVDVQSQTLEKIVMNLWLL
jgi:hypothetical protein